MIYQVARNKHMMITMILIPPSFAIASKQLSTMSATFISSEGLKISNLSVVMRMMIHSSMIPSVVAMHCWLWASVFPIAIAIAITMIPDEISRPKVPAIAP